MALLAEGELVAVGVYKHGPPDGGRIRRLVGYKHGPPDGGRIRRLVGSINMALLAEGEFVGWLGSINMALLAEGEFVGWLYKHGDRKSVV